MAAWILFAYVNASVPSSDVFDLATTASSTVCTAAIQTVCRAALLPASSLEIYRGLTYF